MDSSAALSLGRARRTQADNVGRAQARADSASACLIIRRAVTSLQVRLAGVVDFAVITAHSPWLSWCRLYREGSGQGHYWVVHSPADRAIDLFPENVRMTGVPAGLFDHVHEDPSQRHGLGRYRPAFGGLGEIGRFRDNPVAHRDSRLIVADHRLRVIVIG